MSNRSNVSLLLLLTSDDFNFRTDRPTENDHFQKPLLTYLKTFISNYSNVYIEWKKDLIQGCFKFDLVLPQIRDLFFNLKHLFLNCKLTLFTCSTSYYIVSQLRCFWKRICSHRKSSFTVTSFKNCVFFSEPHYHFYWWNIITFDTIPPIRLDYNEILKRFIKRYLDASNCLVQRNTKGLF